MKEEVADISKGNGMKLQTAGVGWIGMPRERRKEGKRGRVKEGEG